MTVWALETVTRVRVYAVRAIRFRVDAVKRRKVRDFMYRAGFADRRAAVLCEREPVAGQIVPVNVAQGDAAAFEIDDGVIAVLAAVIHQAPEISDFRVRQID